MIARTDRQAIFITAGSLLLLVVLHIIPLPSESRLGQEIENAGHILIFGLYSFILLVFSRQILGRKISKPMIHYLIAAGLSMTTGAVMEYIQQFVARDTDIWDFVRDVVGTASSLAFYLTWDRLRAETAGIFSRWTLVLIRIGAIAAVVITLFPLFSAAGLSLYRRAVFPTLCRFSYTWDRGLVRTQRADFSRAVPPAGWPELRHRHVGRLAMRAGRYPGITLDELIADWSGYHSLRFDIYNAVDTPITLLLRIDDVRYRSAIEDRFNRAIKAAPGPNCIVIPLADVENGPKQRKMDLTEIHSLILFVDRLKTPLTIYIDEIRLY